MNIPFNFALQAVDVIRQSGNVVIFTVQSLIGFEGGSSAADESTQQVRPNFYLLIWDQGFELSYFYLLNLAEKMVSD